MIESLEAGWPFRTTPEATTKICLKGSCCRCITAELNKGHVASTMVTQAAIIAGHTKLGTDETSGLLPWLLQKYHNAPATVLPE